MAKNKGKRQSLPSQQAYFRHALQKAQGRSEQVIAVFIDVRGFSSFSTNRDSVDIGLYIKRLFLSLICDYFPRGRYHKSTGDGMMIIFPYQELTLRRTAHDVIESCIRLHLEFPNMASDDDMITFKVPDACGIGINRGTVCCIESNGETLDYSGHVLNLAARLMDLARPAGIVMHASLGNMIPAELADEFEISSVYVRGIDENQPVAVYSLKGVTSIPESATSPPPKPWGSRSRKLTVAEVNRLATKYWFEVPNAVSKPEDVAIRLYKPGSTKGLMAIEDITEFSIRTVADKKEIVIKTDALKAAAKTYGDDETLELVVKYRQK